MDYLFYQCSQILNMQFLFKFFLIQILQKIEYIQDNFSSGLLWNIQGQAQFQTLMQALKGEIQLEQNQQLQNPQQSQFQQNTLQQQNNQDNCIPEMNEFHKNLEAFIQAGKQLEPELQELTNLINKAFQGMKIVLHYSKKLKKVPNKQQNFKNYSKNIFLNLQIKQKQQLILEIISKQFVKEQILYVGFLVIFQFNLLMLLLNHLNFMVIKFYCKKNRNILFGIILLNKLLKHQFLMQNNIIQLELFGISKVLLIIMNYIKFQKEISLFLLKIIILFKFKIVLNLQIIIIHLLLWAFFLHLLPALKLQLVVLNQIFKIKILIIMIKIRELLCLQLQMQEKMLQNNIQGMLKKEKNM
ncbi:hypothetical protein IMG5_182980, partial [Ichthyophthirius multifiliis]